MRPGRPIAIVAAGKTAATQVDRDRAWVLDLEAGGADHGRGVAGGVAAAERTRPEQPVDDFLGVQRRTGASGCACRSAASRGGAGRAAARRSRVPGRARCRETRHATAASNEKSSPADRRRCGRSPRRQLRRSRSRRSLVRGDRAPVRRPRPARRWGVVREVGADARTELDHATAQLDRELLYPWRRIDAGSCLLVMDGARARTGWRTAGEGITAIVAQVCDDPWKRERRER